MDVAAVQESRRAHVVEAAFAQLRAGVQAMSALVRQADSGTLGAVLIQIRESGIDPLEAGFADGGPPPGQIGGKPGRRRPGIGEGPPSSRKQAWRPRARAGG